MNSESDIPEIFRHKLSLDEYLDSVIAESDSLRETGLLGYEQDLASHSQIVEFSATLARHVKNLAVAKLEGWEAFNLTSAAKSLAGAIAALRNSPYELTSTKEAGDSFVAKSAETLVTAYKNFCKEINAVMLVPAMLSGSIVTELTGQAKDLVDEASSYLSRAKSVDVDAHEGRFATHYVRSYDQRASKHEALARNWLLVLIACIASLCALVYLLPVRGEWAGSNGISLAISDIVSKVVIISSLGFLATLAARSLRAHRHNAIENRRREDSLRTFDRLARLAGESDEARQAVLLQATTAIFSPSTSGFLDEKDSSSAIPIFDAVSSLIRRTR